MSLKRIGCALLAMTLSLPLFMPISSYASGNFRDTTGHWAESFISRAYNKDFVGGYPDGRFLPDKSVTRAEFVSMINKAFEIESSATSNFNDVSYSQWYYDDVSEAVASTYAGGYSDNTFRPNRPVSRQEAAVMLSRILPSYKDGGDLESFRDYRLIADWAVSAMEKMTSRDYMGAYSDGKIHPEDPLTRAQTAKILCEILDNENFVTEYTVIDEDKAKLSGRIYVNDVRIDEDLGDGSATIDNCVILGDLIIEGGGPNSVTINNSRIANVTVDRADGPVRILVKGETTIPQLTAYNACVLESSGKDGYGIPKVMVNEDADLTLKGNFPNVSIDGSNASVALESGKITTLTVARGARYSDITLTGKAQISEATVNAISYFHGLGVITHMKINADGVTYETQPKKMTVGTTIDRALSEGDTSSDVDVEFEPQKRDTSVDLATKVTITFDASMKLASGSEIKNANINGFVSIKTSSPTGAAVEYTAIINSAKKVITITPKSDLSANTRYYVVLAAETLKNLGGSLNEEESIYFTTGTSSSSDTATTFTPDNGDTGVALWPSLKIRFGGDVVKKSDGKEVTDSYLQECIVFKKDSASGANVPFTASISSADRITITPTASLTAGQKYYVAIVADKLKTKKGAKAIPNASATWTVAAATTPPTTATTYATLATLTLAPSGGSNVLTGFSPSTSSYTVEVPFGTTTVDVSATAASGTAIQINGTTTTSVANIAVPSSAITTIRVSSAASGMTTTTYDMNVQVTGNTDLDSISINGTALVTGSNAYAANVTSTATSASIFIDAEDANATIRIGSATGTGSCTTDVSLATGNEKIDFTVTSNRITKTYSIQFSRLAP